MNQGHIPSSDFLFAFLLQQSPPNIKASFIILIEKPFSCKIYETQKKKKKAQNFKYQDKDYQNPKRKMHEINK